MRAASPRRDGRCGRGEGSWDGSDEALRIDALLAGASAALQATEEYLDVLIVKAAAIAVRPPSDRRGPFLDALIQAMAQPRPEAKPTVPEGEFASPFWSSGPSTRPLDPIEHAMPFWLSGPTARELAGHPTAIDAMRHLLKPTGQPFGSYSGSIGISPEYPFQATLQRYYRRDERRIFGQLHLSLTPAVLVLKAVGDDPAILDLLGDRMEGAHWLALINESQVKWETLTPVLLDPMIRTGLPASRAEGVAEVLLDAIGEIPEAEEERRRRALVLLAYFVRGLGPDGEAVGRFVRLVAPMADDPGPDCERAGQSAAGGGRIGGRAGRRALSLGPGVGPDPVGKCRLGVAEGVAGDPRRDGERTGTPGAAMYQDRVDFAGLGLPAALLEPEAAVTVDAAVSFLEGPADDGAGNLYFSDIAGNRILRRAADGTVSTFREPSGRANGNTFDAQGRLVTCEGTEQGLDGGRRVVRADVRTGAVEVLTDRFEGRRYNSPNDVVVDVLGRIWFTDPYYGENREILEQDAEAVYRIDPDGAVTRVLAPPEIERPNGLAITPEGRTLYVVDSHSRPGGNRKIWAFDVGDDGMPANRRLVLDFGRGRGGDGIRLDTQGHLWIAAGIARPRHGGETSDVPPGVYVVGPDGWPLGRIPIAEDVVTNLAFGGPGRRTLFVTAGRTVYRLPVAVAGYALWPPIDG